MSEKSNYSIKRIGGYLYKVSTLKDKKGKILEYITRPLMVELKFINILQIIVGAIILANPVGLTEESWVLGETLPCSMNATVSDILK